MQAEQPYTSAAVGDERAEQPCTSACEHAADDAPCQQERADEQADKRLKPSPQVSPWDCTCDFALAMQSNDYQHTDEVAASAEMRALFVSEFGHAATQVFGLCGENGMVALVAASADGFMALSPSGQVHCPAPGQCTSHARDELRPALRRQWGFHSLNDLQRLPLNGVQCDGLKEKIYAGHPNLGDEVASKGLKKAERLDLPMDSLAAAFNASFARTAEQLHFFALYTPETQSNFIPAMVMALNVASGEFCAISRAAICISGNLNDENERLVQEDVYEVYDCAQVLCDVWGEKFWTKYALGHWAVHDSKNSVLRLHHVLHDHMPAYEIDVVRDAKAYWDNFRLYKMNNDAEAFWVNPFTDWYAGPVKRIVGKADIFFDPTQRPLLACESGLNEFRGFRCDEQQPQDPDHPAPKFLGHLFHVICNGNKAHYQFVLNMWALKIKGVRLRVALIMKGPMGTGKNAVVEMLRLIFGCHVLELNNMSALTGGFNSHLQDKLFIVLNEAHYAGNKQDADMLKSLITEDTLLTTRKFHDSVVRKVHSDFILTSNRDWVMQGSTQNRRYLVLNTKEVPMPKQHFRELFGAMPKEAKELLWMLRRRPLPEGFSAGAALQAMEPTPGAVEQLLHGYEAYVLRWFKDFLQEGKCTIGEGTAFFDDKAMKVDCDALLRAFQEEISNDKNKNKSTNEHWKHDELRVDFNLLKSVTALTQNLNKIFGKDVIQSVRGVYKVPPVKELRDGFQRTVLKCEEYKW
jgi:hypothetical protein